MKKHAHNFRDLTGMTFGKLKVISYSYTKKKDAFWNCICECGKETIKRGSNLTKGGTTTCGCSKISKSPKGHNGFRRLLTAYKSGAIKRNLSFTITENEFKELTQQNCHYCNIKPEQIYMDTNKKLLPETVENGKYFYNGVDRKDNSIGYELTNCVSCCFLCNRAKNNLSYEEFIQYINRFKNLTTYEET